MQFGAPSGVPFSGNYHLEAGEVVTPPGSNIRQTGAASPSGGGGMTGVSIHLDANASQMLRVTAVEYEYENQRRYPSRYGT